MDDKQFTALSHAIIGLTTSQTLLYQYLIKKGVVDKNELANALDFLIDDFNRDFPDQPTTLLMQIIRNQLESHLPDFAPPPPPDQRPKNKHPDWFRGLIQGRKK